MRFVRSLDNDETRVINNGSAVGRARYRERFGTIGTSRGSNALNGVVKKREVSALMPQTL